MKRIIYRLINPYVQRFCWRCCQTKKITVKQVILLLLLFLFFAGCKKQNDTTDKVEIYLLQTHTRLVDTSAAPAIIRYENISLSAVPLVADSDISGYSAVNTTFYLRKNPAPTVRDFGPDKAFAVTVNKAIIYVGEFRPAWLSSVVFGIATITPTFISERQMKIDFIQLDNRPELKDLDRRNDKRLLDALLKSGRLR